MFRESNNTASYSLFDNPWDLVNERTARKYEDPKAWCNVFFDQVTSKIDEKIFAPLFSANGMGAPNASVRILVAMNIIKEGFQLSDEALIERCDADIVIRRALGLMSLGDHCPSLDTYYMFRRRLCRHEAETGEDLMAKCFRDATRKQALEFCVHGKIVRMDSTLVGSNIAWYGRYEIVSRTFAREIDKYYGRLNPALRGQVDGFLSDDPKKFVYQNSSEAVESRLLALGRLIYKVLVKAKVKDGLLHRVFHDQFAVSAGVVSARDRKEIGAYSVQNPSDPDAEYRKKAGEQVKGYVLNAAETFGEDGAPSLVTSISVKGATAADQDFFKDAVEESGNVTGGNVEEVYADGGYQSRENRGIGAKTVFTGIRGKLGRYRYEETEDGVFIKDTQTGKTYKGEYTKGGLIRIEDDREGAKHRWRYFTKASIESMRARQRTEGLTAEERKRRPNVEELMFQFTFHTRNGKTRYRGLLKHKLWAYASGFWINMRKLAIHLGKPAPCMA